jgi:hypothetical protein
MPPARKNLLLVEGKSEQYSIPELMDRHTIWGDRRKDWVVEIIETNGIENLLKPETISTASKTPGLAALGLIVDADDDFAGRWAAVHRVLSMQDTLPNFLPADGLIHPTPRGLRLGVWVMPDNSSLGMLESFLSQLLSPAIQPIWDHARAACEQFPAAHGRSFKASHLDKAKIHTCLAWIDPPGQTLPEAIISRAIDSGSPLAARFVAWMMNLFDLTPRPNQPDASE